MHNFFRRIFFITRAIGPINQDFFGACNGSCDLEPKKVEIHGLIARVLNKFLPEKIMHRAVKFSGESVVLCTRAIQANIFRNFSDRRRPNFNCFYILRFVFPLAFQRRIQNCSTLLQKLAKI